MSVAAATSLKLIGSGADAANSNRFIPAPSLPAPFSESSLSILNQNVDAYCKTEVATAIVQKKVSKEYAKKHGNGDNIATNLPWLGTLRLHWKELARVWANFVPGELIWVRACRESGLPHDYFVKGLSALNRHLKHEYDRPELKTPEEILNHWNFIGTVDEIQSKAKAFDLQYATRGETKHIYNIWANSVNGQLKTSGVDVWLLLVRKYFDYPKKRILMSENGKRPLLARELFPHSSDTKSALFQTDDDDPSVARVESLVDAKEETLSDDRPSYWQFVPYHCGIGESPPIEAYIDEKLRWVGFCMRVGTLHQIASVPSPLQVDAVKRYLTIPYDLLGYAAFLSDKPPHSVNEHLRKELPTAQLLLSSGFY